MADEREDEGAIPREGEEAHADDARDPQEIPDGSSSLQAPPPAHETPEDAADEDTDANANANARGPAPARAPPRTSPRTSPRTPPAADAASDDPRHRRLVDVDYWKRRDARLSDAKRALDAQRESEATFSPRLATTTSPARPAPSASSDVFDKLYENAKSKRAAARPEPERARVSGGGASPAADRLYRLAVDRREELAKSAERRAKEERAARDVRVGERTSRLAAERWRRRVSETMEARPEFHPEDGSVNASDLVPVLAELGLVARAGSSPGPSAGSTGAATTTPPGAGDAAGSSRPRPDPNAWIARLEAACVEDGRVRAETLSRVLERALESSAPAAPVERASQGQDERHEHDLERESWLRDLRVALLLAPIRRDKASGSAQAKAQAQAQAQAQARGAVVDLPTLVARHAAETERTKQRKEELKRRLAEEEAKRHPFAPKLVAAPSPASRSFDRLYEDARERAARLDEVRAREAEARRAAELAACTFSPRTNVGSAPLAPASTSASTSPKREAGSQSPSHMSPTASRALKTRPARPVLFSMRVGLPDGSSVGALEIRAGDDVDAVVRRFAKRHDLAPGDEDALLRRARDERAARVGSSSPGAASKGKAWEVRWSEEHARWYFYDPVSDESVWELPDGEQPSVLQYVVS